MDERKIRRSLRIFVDENVFKAKESFKTNLYFVIAVVSLRLPGASCCVFGKGQPLIQRKLAICVASTLNLFCAVRRNLYQSIVL